MVTDYSLFLYDQCLIHLILHCYCIFYCHTAKIADKLTSHGKSMFIFSILVYYFSKRSIICGILWVGLHRPSPLCHMLSEISYIAASSLETSETNGRHHGSYIYHLCS